MSQPPLQDSPSPLYRPAWRLLLQQYPGDLPTVIDNILEYGALLGYTGPARYIISRNLKSVNLNPAVLTDKIATDIALRRIKQVNPTPPGPYISSPLGLVPKPNNKWRPIHHLSFPRGQSVNDSIAEEAAYFKFTTFEQVLAMVLKAGKDCIMLKRDMKDAFRMIPIAPKHQWLMGFNWNNQFYVETVLSFGLRTAPFLFNLFAEAWEWIIISYLRWKLIKHYLDDTMAVFPANTIRALSQFKKDYSLLCRLLGILENKDKDEEGTLVRFLGRMVNSTNFTVSIPHDKVDKVVALTSIAIKKQSMTLHEAQTLAGLLTFCSSAVQLGYVFCRRLWSFIATFKPEWRKSYKRRIPQPVREDIIWWNSLFPTHNGIRFFDDSNRRIVHLFADASVLGMGAFYFDTVDSEVCDWKDYAAALPQNNALALLLPDHDPTTLFDINIYEITAMLRAFERWGRSWAGKLVILHSDSSTTQLGLIKQTLRAETQNEPLRQLLLLAAKHDIKIEPRHLPGKENGLADALSRDLQEYITNWCPHWQISYHSLSHLRDGPSMSPSLRELNSFFTTA